MTLASLENKRILFLGYGREGRSAHAYLAQHLEQATFGIADASLEISTALPAVLHLGDDYMAAIAQYDCIFRSPTFPYDGSELRAARANGQQVTSLTELFFSLAPGKIIGISGTKGKSTTSALLHQMLELAGRSARLVGNIGRPALDYLDGADAGTLFVTELSSFQLEGLTCSPHCAVLLDIVPEHLDHHGSLEGYRESKFNVLRHQTSENIAVLSPAASHYQQSSTLGLGQRMLYGTAETGCRVIDGALVVAGTQVAETQAIADLDALPLQGPGNVQNMLAATAAAIALGVTPNVVAQALKSFTPLPHRLNNIGTFVGIDFYNDSLATIPQATLHAVQALGARVQTLILGGYDRGIDFTPLADGLLAHLSHISTFILFPTTGEKIWQLLQTRLGGMTPPRVLFATSMAEAVQYAYQHTTVGNICLLSPASSSFSMFRDYHERGEAFKNEVVQQAQVQQQLVSNN